MKLTDAEQQRYIVAYTKIFKLKEEDVKAYVEKKGITALVKNPEELLQSKERMEHYQAFLKLYHMTQNLEIQKDTLNSPEAAAAFAQSVMTDIYRRESFVAIFLDSKLRPITYEEISIGSLESSAAHPREIFANALRNNANSIIVCHNHPSGDVTPSASDIAVTGRLKAAGELMGIPVLDHVIVDGMNPERVYSFREDGYVFEGRIRYMEGMIKEENIERKGLDGLLSEIKKTQRQTK